MIPSTKSKWLRRLVQAVVMVVSLFSLCWAALNWWAAGAKKDVLADLKASGRITAAADFESSLPPEEENFAMIPLFKGVRDEVAEKGSEGLPPESSYGRLSALGLVEEGNGLLKLPRRGKDFDLGAIQKQLDFSGDATETLDQFDQRHREVLEALRHGIGRKQAVSPRYFDLTNPESLFNSSSVATLVLMKAATGLALRAELALAAGRGDIALESLLIGRRLTDLAGSESTALGNLIAWNANSRLAVPLARGIESGTWNEPQLDKIRSSLERLDFKQSVVRSLNLEGVGAALLFDRAKSDRGIMIRMSGGGDNFENRLKWEIMPGGWFDLNSSRALESTGKWIGRIETEAPMRTWWEGITPQSSGGRGYVPEIGEDGNPVESWLKRSLLFHELSNDVTAQILVKKASLSAVNDAQSRLACQLARYRLIHGTYPARLDLIGGSGITDPMTGQPFAYRPEGSGFVLYSVGRDGIDNGGVSSKLPLSSDEVPDLIW